MHTSPEMLAQKSSIHAELMIEFVNDLFNSYRLFLSQSHISGAETPINPNAFAEALVLWHLPKASLSEFYNGDNHQTKTFSEQFTMEWN